MNVHLGIDIGGTFIKYGIIDSDGHIEFSSRTPSRDPDNQDAPVDTIRSCASEMMKWATDAGHTPVSVGIGSPGTVNPVTHTIQPPSPNIPELIGVNFIDIVSRETGLPTVIDNDANCAAWAEYRYGAGRGLDQLICLTVGSGLGSGFIVDGQLLSSPSGSGGELGHVSINYDGPACPCGNRGCLEKYTSGNAMLKRAEAETPSQPDGLLMQSRDPETGRITIKGLMTTASQGDSLARRILTEAAEKLGVGILTAVNIIDPEAVIIGGGVADGDAAAGGFWLDTIIRHVHRHAFSEAGKNLQIGRAVLGNDAGFIGAAALGARALIDDSD